MQVWNSTKNYQEFHIVLEAGDFAKLIDEAKAMHKEEIRKAYCYGEYYKDAKLTTDYYAETFGDD